MNRFKEIKAVMMDELFMALKDKKAIILIASYVLLVFIGVKIGSFFELLSLFYAKGKVSFSLSLPYYMSIILLPLFSMLISYDSISGEIYQGSIKFIAYKINRSSIIIGKYLSALILSSSLILITYVFMTFYIFTKLKQLLIMESVIAWLYLSIYAACFIALTILISTITKNPQTSIRASIFIIAVVLILKFIDYIRWISPFQFYGYGIDYLINGTGNIILGAVFLAVYALAYLIASLMILSRCDL